MLLRARFPLIFMLLITLVIATSAIDGVGCAYADGDPGSDELIVQNEFLPTSTDLSAAQEIQIGKLLAATVKAGAPIKVAVIPTKLDIGTVTPLWRKPSLYVNYLGEELSEVFSGRLLVVMPNGVGVAWFAKRTPDDRGAREMAAALAHGARFYGVRGQALMRTITSMVDRLEGAAGVSPSMLDRYARSVSDRSVQPSTALLNGSPEAAEQLVSQGDNGSGSDGWLIAGCALVMLVVLGVSYRLSGFGERLNLPHRLRRLGIHPFAALPVAFSLLVVIVLLADGGNSGSSVNEAHAAAKNAQLDTGTVLAGNRTAPNFTLYSQTGQKVSLKQFRGKVVILSFIDAECETICPLTTQAMLDAKRSLGAAGKDVQLLGVDANWKSTQIQDVLSYTQEHGMMGEWQFLTDPNSLSALERVWSAYKVNEFKDSDQVNGNVINHLAATYVIDPRGKLRAIYVSENTTYTTIPQFGQELARDASEMLPSHPRVSTHYTYQAVRGIRPYQTTTLPKVGGGTATLGPGKPRLYVFFDTWDRNAGLTKNLEKLNAYAVAARREGLPALTAIDEGSVEPNARALPEYLKTLPTPLKYSVAIDQTGQIADGYRVQGEPWFVMVSGTGQRVWVQDEYTQNWPGITQIKEEARGDLKKVADGVPTSNQVQQQLSGSPAPLARLHRQSNELLSGGISAVQRRIQALHGFPVVVNVWAADCEPCQKEVKLFQNASAAFGKDVAFIGVDTDGDPALGQSFLRAHPVSYPSYGASENAFSALVPGGIQGTPTTIFYTSTGHRTVIPGAFDTQAELDTAVGIDALGPNGCAACK